MSRPTLVRVLAPAKVNLRLEVLGRRGDGYHEVRTWMLALALGDRIEARASASGKIALAVTGAQAGADVTSGAENLAWRAASAVLEEGRRRGLLLERDGLELVLEKSIPTRSGLGGGSSDAAAAWIAAERALGLELGREAAAAALAGLGSDCAFFIGAQETGCALCAGRGERVTAMSGPPSPFTVAVLVPEVACPTAAVYAALDRGRSGGGSPPEPPADWTRGPASRMRPFLWNRLEEAAIDAFPELRRWRQLLDATGADLWPLSGSGSAFFGVFDRLEEAEEALARLRGAADRAGLGVRGAWAGAPAGRGANIVEVR